MDNPLLSQTHLPAFSQIKPEHVLPALETVLADNRAAIESILSQTAAYSWENLVLPMAELDDRLQRLWSPVSHLHNVQDSDELREVYDQGLGLITAYQAEVGQNAALNQAYKAVKDSDDFEQLDYAQQKVVTNMLRQFHLAGVDLPDAQKARCKEIMQQLSQLSSKFGQNVLDATHAWKKHITDEADLQGLPDSVKALLKQNAQQAELEGWVITLDMPCYQPVLTYADNRELRQELYQAFVTRASEFNDGQWDNSGIMQQIMTLRQELAELLHFDNYAALSVYQKMADSPDKVLEFLDDLAEKSKPFALTELEQVKAFAQENDGLQDFTQADLWYYSEKLKQAQYDISQEALRPYFALPQVTQGMFDIVQRLYGITIQARDDVDVWHEDVTFYEIHDENGELRGQFYLDPYARQKKRGGAWMDECVIRKKVGESIQYPVAYLACNFTPPVDGQPSLLTHNEVTTLFHEFGHGLHHMLTQVDYSPVSGINGVEWDAVELPSQFMENWCWEKPALDLFAKHVETGENLPDTLFEKLNAAKNFQAGLFMLRQLEFGLFDFRLHKEFSADTDIQALLNSVREQVSVLPPPEFNRFQHSFAHIFAGGYAAGYYSYKWAEVLAADAFSLFEEQGIFNRETGQSFMQNVLERGGSKGAMDLFIAFRGREPKVDALLSKLVAA
ncbi:oligopeptidase A [Candidatus Albibeggiatoa sp. nov. NOAA]|uniref:oligopeptidase A n=1 Tax=Candidatus Albibeggiatoa sp. nov. NOAA TaxID=3162724 RepID=UPI0032FA42D5|nr:oligopeptidase A [Thiotrichaceae bacterium]